MIKMFAAYLNELKKCPILSKEQEQLIAKSLREAEEQKKVFTEKWVLLLSKQISLCKTNKSKKSSLKNLDGELYELIQSTIKIKHLRKKIKTIESEIANKKPSTYARKKFNKEKADCATEINNTISGANLIKIHNYSSCIK